MAEHLASIFGTEKDRVNCPFYFKIGACRHGDRCSRLHTRPTISPTILLSNMYQKPDYATPGTEKQVSQLDPRKVQEDFEDFYEDLFEELSRYGEIESLNVCDNLADHMVGNVYVNFREEEQAAAALRSLTGRFYSGRPIIADFSPVTDFREATCRQHEEQTCNRGGYCNFMHLRRIGRRLRYKLFGNKRSRSRSVSPSRDYRSRDDDRGRYSDRYGGRDSRSGGRGGSYSSRGYGEHSGGYRDHDDGRSRVRRDRSNSPDRRREREGSAERRAKIEQWNRERDERDRAQGSGGERQLPPPPPVPLPQPPPYGAVASTGYPPMQAYAPGAR